MAETLHLKVVGKFPAALCKFLLPKFLCFLWCIVTDLSLVSSSPYDNNLSFYLILKALSWMRFILLLSPLLWNIHSRGQYPNCYSINDLMIIRFLLTFIKGAIGASALSFRVAFLHKRLLTCHQISIHDRLLFLVIKMFLCF